VTVAGLATHYYADMYGRDTAVTDPGGHIYKLHYGGTFGNLDSTLAAGTGQPVQYTRTTFDGYGRDSIERASGSAGDTTVYDSTNRVVRVAAPGHHVVTTAYDPLFRRTVTDAKGQVYRDSINALGWRVERTDPTGAVTTYRYNRDGLLTSTTNRRQQIVARRYDALHRLLADSVSSTVVDSFAYNATGPVQVGWNAVSRDSAFTNAVTGWTDSVVTRFATSAGSERFRRYYRPTALQQLDSLGLTSPSTITLTGRRYFWNATTGQLDSIAVGASHFRMHYNADGLPDTLTYPGGAKRGTLYSSVHLPTRQAFSLTALDTVLSHSYRYDSLGQMLEDDHKMHAGANESMHVFSYDATGQLAALQVMELNNDTTCVTNGDFGIECADTTYAITDAANAFQYDSVGNLRTDFDSSSMSPTTGTYTTGDRQSAWGATHYTYDADGNRLTRVTGSETVHYYWSPEGLLDSVRAAGATITYAYNASGQLVRRSGHGMKRYFLWDNGQLLAELDSTATHRVGEYAYAPGTDAPIALVTGSGTVQQVVQDVNGNVIGLFTGSSTITERETYACRRTPKFPQV
jgi:YD repeat-containing protein